MVIPTHQEDEIMDVARRNVVAYLRANGNRPRGDDSNTRVSHNGGMTSAQQVFDTIALVRNRGVSSVDSSSFLPISRESTEYQSHASRCSLDSLPMDLFEVLEGELFLGSISWTQSGDGWKIVSLDSFFSNVLPVFTGGSSMEHFADFVRLLDLWGFKQIPSGIDAPVFQNVNFRRGQRDLLNLMVKQDDKASLCLENTSELASEFAKAVTCKEDESNTSSTKLIGESPSTSARLMDRRDCEETEVEISKELKSAEGSISSKQATRGTPTDSGFDDGQFPSTGNCPSPSPSDKLAFP